MNPRNHTPLGYNNAIHFFYPILLGFFNVLLCIRDMDINTEKLKQSVVRQIETERPQLQELALKIHANPELGLQEFKACEWLTQYLTKRDFNIERGICEMPTAFRATYGKGKPSIALLAEYDALPGVGHACGHNLICTIAIGAAVASKIDR